MSPRLNDGSRPSKLEVGRHLVGEQELSPEAQGHPNTRAWVEAVRVATPPPFSAENLRLRAAALEREASADNVVPLFRRLVPYLGATLAMAAAAMLAVNVPIEAENRTKGQTELGFYVFRDGDAFPGDETDPVRAGDQVQFTYHPGAYNRLVVVGVDGSGTAQVYFPDEGERAMPVVPGERHVLEGSIMLDDAPGPEIFVAFFDGKAPTEAAREVRLAWNAGGAAALAALDQERDDVAILVLDKE